MQQASSNGGSNTDPLYRFSHTPSPLGSPRNDYYSSPSSRAGDGTDLRAMAQQLMQRLWQHLLCQRPAPPEPSGYLTLIPLSDARLKPRNTKLLVVLLVLLVVGTASCVFLLVPRGVGVGTIHVKSTKMAFNQTSLTYAIQLMLTLHVYNPNYLDVQLSGQVNVSFYTEQAGFAILPPMRVGRRVFPEVLTVMVDADDLPKKYTQVIYSNCFNFPRKLVFFLQGALQAEYLGNTVALPPVDTYTILDCTPPDDVVRAAEAALQSWREPEDPGPRFGYDPGPPDKEQRPRPAR